MININYIWDESTALKSAEDIYLYELKHSRKRFMGWFFIALVQFGVVGVFKHNSYGILMVGTIGAVYWYGFRWQLRKYFIKKTFIKSPLANKQISLEASDTEILNHTQTQIIYKDIKKLIKLDDAIIIYHKFGTIYLPNSAFSDAKNKQKFINYINLILNSK